MKGGKLALLASLVAALASNILPMLRGTCTASLGSIFVSTWNIMRTLSEISPCFYWHHDVCSQGQV